MGGLPRTGMIAGDGTRATRRCARFIVPAAAGRTSGGFLVNDRLLRPGDGAVAKVTTTEELVDELEALGASDAAIVDSLFLFDHAEATALVRAAERSRIVLMAHSLPSLIPGTDAASRRRMLCDERAFLSVCAGAVAPSAFMAAALNRRGLRPHATAVIPPAPVCDGREPDRSAGTRSKRPDEPGPHRTAALLTVANWTAAKGIDHAAQALVTLADLEWRWTVVGARADDGYSRGILESLRRAGLENRVELVDPVPPTDLRAHYERADLFLLPSLMESYGLVYAEALSHGIPVAGYRCAAVPEVVGKAGLLVPAGRADLLARAVREYLSGLAPEGSSTGTAHRESGAVGRLRDLAAERATSLPRWSTVRSRFAAAIARLDAEGPLR